jgi:phospholipid-translocating ATPase
MLTKAEYEKWQLLYTKANEKMENRELEVRKAISALENNMEFLGITGVEDKLQESVC